MLLKRINKIILVFILSAIGLWFIGIGEPFVGSYGANLNYFTLAAKNFIRFGLVLLFIQIMLGGWTSTNYAALACTDFPTCHGSFIPDMDFKNAFNLFRELGMTASGEGLSIQALQAIQWVHRVGAIILTTYFIYMAYLLRSYPPIRFYRNLLLLVLFFQVIIGIANLLMYLPLFLAILHNLGAALLVIIMVIINSRITPQYDESYIN